MCVVPWRSRASVALVHRQDERRSAVRACRKAASWARANIPEKPAIVAEPGRFRHPQRQLMVSRRLRSACDAARSGRQICSSPGSPSRMPDSARRDRHRQFSGVQVWDSLGWVRPSLDPLIAARPFTCIPEALCVSFYPKSGTWGVALSGRIGGLGRDGNGCERMDCSPCG